MEDTEHEQQIIFVRRPDGKRKRIVCDTGIASLIKELWSKGVETMYSCQGDDESSCPYVMVKAVSSNRAFEVLRHLWRCRIERESFYDGVAFYALKNEAMAALWDKIREERIG